MKKTRYTEEQIAFALKQAATGTRVEEVCRKIQDEKIRHFMFRRNGKGTPGHLRIPEAEEMAEELSAYIENLDIEW